MPASTPAKKAENRGCHAPPKGAPLTPCKGLCQLLHLAVPPAARNDGWNPPFAPGPAATPAELSEKRVFQKNGRICLETRHFGKSRALPT
jgi:hypothetical protein